MVDVQSVAYPNANGFDGYRGPVTAARVSRISDVEQLDRRLVNAFTEWSDQQTPVERTHDRSAVDLRVRTKRNSFRVDTGSFDTDAVADALPSRSNRGETLRGHQVYTVVADPEYPDRSGYLGYAVGSDTILKTVAATRHGVVDYIRSLLRTGAGEVAQFVDAHEDTGAFVDELGDGDWTLVRSLGTDHPTGVTMQFEGETTERRFVAMFESAEAASDSDWARPGFVDVLREPVEERPSPSILRGKYAHYDDFEHAVDGRFVRITGTIDTSDVAGADLGFP